MKTNLYIIGAGSVGGHIATNISQYSNHFEVAGFYDDDPDKIGTEIFGIPVIGKVEQVLSLSKEKVAIGISFPRTKKKILEMISHNKSLSFPSLIHEKSWVSSEVKIGAGCVIYPGTSINYGSVINDFAVLNMNCAIGHHTHIGTCTSFAPGINTGGHTFIGNYVDVGIGVSTLQDVQIGDLSIIGGQSMVVKDVKSGSKVVGVPAKQMK